jgi:acyl-CoA synthetase (AMP-forming)/AMP-acid ligase II
MAAWKIPERLVVVPELPVTARGKPDRTALRTLIRGA